MKKIIISVIIVVLLLSAVTVTVMYKMGEKFLEEMILTDIGDITDITSDIDEGNGSSENKNKTGNSNSSTYDSSNTNSDNTSGKTDGDKDNSQNSDGERKNQSKNNEGSTVNTQKPKSVITIEKAKEIQESITFTDKMTAAALVAKRLSTDDINVLKGMANGGLSPEEKEKAKKIAFERFTPEEIKEIKEIYHKYMDK